MKVTATMCSLLLAGATSAAALADADGCGKDTDCKGARVCVQRQCVSPPAMTACSKDIDCTGPEVCTDHACVLPTTNSAPSPRAGPISAREDRVGSTEPSRTVQATATNDRFGSRGQVVPLGSISVGYSSASTTGASGSLTNVSIEPSLLIFVADNIGLGVSGVLDYSNLSSSGSTTAFGGELSLAYNIWLSESVSIVPGGGLGVASSDSAGPRLTAIALELSVPLLFHPVRHFFFGFGPQFLYTLAASLSTSGEAPKVTSIGVATAIGGYF
jgi:hypothetical protein